MRPQPAADRAAQEDEMSPLLSSGPASVPRYLLALLPWALACGEELPSASDPGPGELRVSIVTTGEWIDPDGYLVHIDLQTGVRVASNGSRVFILRVGPHSITLSDVSPTCILHSLNWRTFISTGQQSVLEVRVKCPEPGYDPGYDVTTGLDGNETDRSRYRSAETASCGSIES